MLRNMSVASFKSLVNAAKFDIIKNPKDGGKIFAAGDNGQCYKVEQAIDVKKPIVVLIDGDDLDTACFINERPSNSIVTL